jgi:hypothetical protein
VIEVTSQLKARVLILQIVVGFCFADYHKGAVQILCIEIRSHSTHKGRQLALGVVAIQTKAVTVGVLLLDPTNEITNQV